MTSPPDDSRYETPDYEVGEVRSRDVRADGSSTAGPASPLPAAPTLPAAARPPLRPLVGLPLPAQRWWQGTLVAVLLHAIVVLLLVSPVLASQRVRDVITGAGGPGPAGGGGGGSRGTGGAPTANPERLQYMHAPPVAPPTPAAIPPATPPVTPPVVPPVVPPQPTPQPPTPAPSTATPAATPAAAPTPGTGGGTGTDGTAGTGPGSGGGVGTGVGTGVGSGTGPGTGGGPGDDFPPTPTELIMPPFDPPRSVRGSRIVVVFDVDSIGRVVKVEFTPTRDGGYNRRFRERMLEYRFRPGHRRDGVPIRAKAQIEVFI